MYAHTQTRWNEILARHEQESKVAYPALRSYRIEAKGQEPQRSFDAVFFYEKHATRFNGKTWAYAGVPLSAQ